MIPACGLRLRAAPCTWAKQLGHDDVLALLEESLSEEKEADKKLNRLAKKAVNKMAAA
jgi:ferritin-like metal-binding protein YciE